MCVSPEGLLGPGRQNAGAIFVGAFASAKFKLRPSGIELRGRTFAIKLVVQMTEHPKRRRKSDLHIVDLPTVVLAAAVVVLLVVACVVRLVSH